MRKLLPALLLALPLALHAQVKTVTDSLLVIPGNNGMLMFYSRYQGKLYQLGPDSFARVNTASLSTSKIITSYTHFVSPPLKIDDCVYFDPLKMISTTSNCERRRSYLYSASMPRFMQRYIIRSAGVQVPNAIRFYLDSAMQNSLGELCTDDFSMRTVQPLLGSFYFRKTEVSNKEYREFLNWVRDSIIHVRLGHRLANGYIDWKQPLPSGKELKQKVPGVYYESDRPRTYQFQPDPAIFLYRFAQSPEGFADTLAVYPDTLCWSREFVKETGEPYTNMYFWHPAYDEGPVVGVSYAQCLAFLEWKTRQLQKELDHAGKPYRVECNLPSEAEWDMASTAEKKKKKLEVYGEHYPYLADSDWRTDLRLAAFLPGNRFVIQSTDFETFQKKRIADSLAKTQPGGDHVYLSESNRNPKDVRYRNATPGLLMPGEFASGSHQDIDGVPMLFATTGQPFSRHSYMRSQRRKGKEIMKTNPFFQAHTDPATGIVALDGNVSEWMRENLEDNWAPLMRIYLQPPPFGETKEQQLAKDIDRFYFEKLPKNGRLVRGGNWFDERYNLAYGKNIAGITRKTFVAPEEQHATVGFRYVVHVVSK